MHKHRIAQRLVLSAISIIVGIAIALVAIPNSAVAQGSSTAQKSIKTKKHADQPHYDPPSEPPSTTRRGPYAGSLDQPLQYYTVSDNSHDGPTEFLHIVRSMGWNGYDRSRKCKGGEGCGNDALTWMRVQASEDANAIPFTRIPADQRVVVGRLENIGLYHDIWYSDLPRPQDNNGLTAEGYFVIEGSKTGGSPTLAILQFQNVSGTWKWTLTTYPDPTASFKTCDKRKHNAYGDFKPKCKFTRAELGARYSVADASDALAWFSCLEGCCGSSFPRRPPGQGGDQ